MFAGTYRCMRSIEKVLLEVDQRTFHICKPVFRNKGTLQTLVLPVVPLQKIYKIEQIGVVEGSVSESHQLLQVCSGVVHNKFIRLTIKSPSQFQRFLNDGLPLSPGKYRSKEAHYLNLLLQRELVRHKDRVVLDERYPVVLIRLPVEKIFQLLL